MKDLPKPEVFDFEVAFSTYEIINALSQAAVNEGRLPSGVMLTLGLEFIKDERNITHAILKAKKSDK